MHLIKRLVDGKFEDAGTFKERPAPHPTLYGHLLALEAETGDEHVAFTEVEWARVAAMEAKLAADVPASEA